MKTPELVAKINCYFFNNKAGLMVKKYLLVDDIFNAATSHMAIIEVFKLEGWDNLEHKKLLSQISPYLLNLQSDYIYIVTDICYLYDIEVFSIKNSELTGFVDNLYAEEYNCSFFDGSDIIFTSFADKTIVVVSHEGYFCRFEF